MVDGPLDVDQRRQDLAVSRLGVSLATVAEGVEDARGPVDRLDSRDDPHGPGPKLVDHVQPAPTDEDPECTPGLLDQPRGDVRRVLRLQEADVGVLPVERGQAGRRELDPEVDGRVLHGDRQRDRVGHGTEESQELDLRQVGHGRRLEDQPGGAVLDGEPGELDLATDRVLADRDREREPAAERLGDRRDDLTALRGRQLVDLRAEAHDADPVATVANRRLDLRAPERVVDAIVGRVERDQHRVDPRGFRLHRGDPPSRGSRYSATTASFSSTPIPGASESVMCPSRATASPMNSSDRNVSPSR